MSEDKNLRKAGLKVTLPRVRILEIFEQSSERHLSAEDIYKKIRDSGDEVGLATVYRVLTQFESAGILMKQNFEDNYSVYELVSEDHHDHMVCIDSGAVIEFKNDLIEEEQEKMGLSEGLIRFSVGLDQDISRTYEGIKKCLKEFNLI